MLFWSDWVVIHWFYLMQQTLHSLVTLPPVEEELNIKMYLALELNCLLD